MNPLLVAAIALFMSAPAQGTDKSAKKWLALKKFGACLAGVEHGRADRFLQTDPGSIAEHKMGQALAADHPYCLRLSGLTIIRGGAMRGAVASEMLRHEPALLDNLAARPASPPLKPAQGLQLAVFTQAYARCLARSSPARSVAVVRTAETTPAERTAVLAFGNLLKEFMPTDIAYHLDVSDLRAHLASELYLTAHNKTATLINEYRPENGHVGGRG